MDDDIKFLSKDELHNELALLRDRTLYKISTLKFLVSENGMLILSDGVILWEKKPFQTTMWVSYPWEKIVRLEVDNTSISRVTNLGSTSFKLIEGVSKADLKRFEASIISLKEEGKIPKNIAILNLME